MTKVLKVEAIPILSDDLIIFADIACMHTQKCMFSSVKGSQLEKMKSRPGGVMKCNCYVQTM